jgi:hypothetical protein
VTAVGMPPIIRKFRMSDEWTIACHEAGHAIIAIRHRIAFTSAEIGPNEHGMVEPSMNPIDDDELEWTKEDVKRYQEFYAAGAAAERLMFRKEREHAQTSDKSCHEQLERLGEQIRSSGFEEDVEAAIGLLDRTLIEAVARKLRDHGKLTVEDVCAEMKCSPWWES